MLKEFYSMVYREAAKYDLADFYHDLCLAFTNNVGLLDLKKSCDVLPWLEKELWAQRRAIFTFVNYS